MNNDIRWGGLTLADLNTKEQLSFLTEVLKNPNETRVLTGCAGSGKTLLAAFVIDQLRVSNHIDAGFLVFTKLLEKFVGDNFDAESDDYPIAHFHSWQNNPIRKHTYVIDESQDFRKSWIDLVRANSDNQIWIGDEQQQIYEESRVDQGFTNLISQIKKTQFANLSTNYRNSLSIAKFASKFINISETESKGGITLNDKVNKFIAPIIKNVTNKQNDPVYLIKAYDVEQEFDAIAMKINEIQSNPNIKGKQIVVSHMLHEKGDGINLDLIEKHLAKRKIEFIRISKSKSKENLPDFKQKNMVIVSPIHSLKGLEVDYVFFPRSEDATLWRDPISRDNLLFVLFTRPRFQLFCSYVNDENNYILNKLSDVKALDYVVKIDANEILNQTDIKSDEKDDLDNIEF